MVQPPMRRYSKTIFRLPRSPCRLLEDCSCSAGGCRCSSMFFLRQHQNLEIGVARQQFGDTPDSDVLHRKQYPNDTISVFEPNPDIYTLDHMVKSLYYPT